MKKVNFIIAFIYLFVLPLSSEEDPGISMGHQYLQSKDYEKAAEVYQQLEDEGFESISLYYNLGIAKYELGNFPEAILYFEKALKKEPNNKSIKHNLELTNQQLDQDFIEVESFFLVRWWKKFVLTFSLGLWTFIALLTVVLTVVSFYFYLFGKTILSVKTGMRLFYPFLLLSLIFLLSLNNRYRQLTDDSNAILLENGALYEGPDTRSMKLYDLNPGTKITIKDTLEGWIKIELINKENGWMESNGFERI